MCQRLAILAFVCLAHSLSPLSAQVPQQVAAKLQALTEQHQERTSPAVSVSAATARCSLRTVENLVTILEAQTAVEVWEPLHNGEFMAAGRVDADDPRNHVVDTNWVSASWSSPSGVLWGRDYAPDTAIEGITRLLDNRRTRRNAYALSFASLTPRAVLNILNNEGTDDAWLFLSINGAIAGIPSEDDVSDIGWPLCADGLFFLDDAFDARGYIPAKYLRFP